MAKIGDERFLAEYIAAADVEALAKSEGWLGEEISGGLREFCEPEDAATYKAFRTLAEAQDAARKWLLAGNSFYGCVIIDRQVYEQRMPIMRPEWETYQSYEIAMDGETIEVNR